jgi:hypothetical protein
MPSHARDTMPDRGLVFWPVGNGDSTTVLIDHASVLQVDLHDMAQADEADDPHVPVIDRLVELLPTGSDGRPYLAGFALTHPDLDHCRGFADLLERVTIGELWLTPRVFRDNTDGELSEDAQAYCDEAMRRVKKTIASGGVARSGDRVRIIGYDDLLAEDDFKGFPKELLTIPGTAVTTLDGTDHAGVFRVHPQPVHRRQRRRRAQRDQPGDAGHAVVGDLREAGAPSGRPWLPDDPSDLRPQRSR